MSYTAEIHPMINRLRDEDRVFIIVHTDYDETGDDSFYAAEETSVSIFSYGDPEETKITFGNGDDFFDWEAIWFTDYLSQKETVIKGAICAYRAGITIVVCEDADIFNQVLEDYATFEEQEAAKRATALRNSKVQI